MTFKKLRTFIGSCWPVKLLVVEAFVVLLVSKAVVRLLPFKTVAARLGTLNASARDCLTVVEQKEAQRIRYALLAASANVPWRSVCMDQALAATFMLNRRKLPNSLFLGVRLGRQAQKLNAHAWVTCNKRVFVGGAHSEKYTVVAVFSKY